MYQKSSISIENSQNRRRVLLTPLGISLSILKLFMLGLTPASSRGVKQLSLLSIYNNFYQSVLKNPIQRKIVTLNESFQDAHHIILTIGGSSWIFPRQKLFINDLLKYLITVVNWTDYLYYKHLYFYLKNSVFGWYVFTHNDWCSTKIIKWTKLLLYISNDKKVFKYWLIKYSFTWKYVVINNNIV